MPGGTGVISDRRWTVALEAKGENGIQTRYNSDVSVGQHVERLGAAGSRFKLIGGNAAVDKSAKPILIRNLVARDGSDKQAIHRIPHPPRRASTCIRRSPRSFRPSRREAEKASDRPKRLYALVEDGVAEMDDLLKDRIATLEADRDRALDALTRARAAIRTKAKVAPEAAERFGAVMRSRLLEGDTPVRKAWIGTFVDRIEINLASVRILGTKDVLEQAVACGGDIPSGVRTFVPKWRAVLDKSAITYVREVAI